MLKYNHNKVLIKLIKGGEVMLNMVNDITKNNTEGFEDFLLRSQYSCLLLDEQEFTNCEIIKDMVKTGEIISVSEITDNRYIIRTRKNGLQNLEIL